LRLLYFHRFIIVLLIVTDDQRRILTASSDGYVRQPPTTPKDGQELKLSLSPRFSACAHAGRGGPLSRLGAASRGVAAAQGAYPRRSTTTEAAAAAAATAPHHRKHEERNSQSTRARAAPTRTLASSLRRIFSLHSLSAQRHKMGERSAFMSRRRSGSVNTHLRSGQRRPRTRAAPKMSTRPPRSIGRHRRGAWPQAAGVRREERQ